MQLVHDSRESYTKNYTNYHAREELGRLLRTLSRLKAEHRGIPDSLLDTIAGIKRQLGLY